MTSKVSKNHKANMKNQNFVIFQTVLIAVLINKWQKNETRKKWHNFSLVISLGKGRLQLSGSI